MAKTTVVNTLFGAPGVSDPQVFHPGLVCVKRRIDFSKSNTSASTFYALLALPKSFVAVGAFCESGADKNGSYPAATAFTLKVADADDNTNDITIGASFTPSNSAYKRETKLTGYAGTVASTTATITGGPTVFDSGAIVGAELGAQTTGYVEVGVFGYVPDGDSLGNVVTPGYRDAQQATVAAKDNVGKIDPYHGK